MIFRRIRGRKLEERVERAVYALSMQATRLQQIARDTERLAKSTFDKCVKAQVDEDKVRASLYATECAQARKVHNAVLLAQTALEQIQLRLRTIKELKTLMQEVAPIAKIAKSLRGNIAHLAPGVSFELRDIDNVLGNMMVEAGSVTKLGEIGVLNEEARRIIDEASVIAEQRVKETFPKPLPEAPESEREV